MDTQQQKQFKILIIGDSCEDVYHYGFCNRLSPEAPVPIFKETRKLKMPGMSSNVVENLDSFGANVTHLTNSEPIQKHRFIDERFRQHLLRVDVGEDEIINRIDTNDIKNKLNYDAVIISDYNKGYLNPEDCDFICSYFSEKQVPIFVDSKKSDLKCFHDCWLKINDKEFDNSRSLPYNAKILVTLGQNGVKYGEKIYSTDKVEVFDVCGAGDVFLATLVNYFLLTKNIESAIAFANKFASYSVTKSGTYKLTKQDIIKITQGKHDV